MSCSPFDLRDYFLRELSEPERNQVELHMKDCQSCREELDRLQVAEAALFSLRDEEIPQRIAFVSDKIFEPSPLRRWWTGFWGSASRLGFASAAMLSVALMVFAFTRQPSVVPLTVAQSPATQARASVSDADLQQRIQAAVNQAVAATEGRLEKKMEQRVADVEVRAREERRQLAIAAAELDILNRHQLVLTSSAYGPPRTETGEVK